MPRSVYRAASFPFVLVQEAEDFGDDLGGEVGVASVVGMQSAHDAVLDGEVPGHARAQVDDTDSGVRRIRMDSSLDGVFQFPGVVLAERDEHHDPRFRGGGAKCGQGLVDARGGVTLIRLVKDVVGPVVDHDQRRLLTGFAIRADVSLAVEQ